MWRRMHSDLARQLHCGVLILTIASVPCLAAAQQTVRPVLIVAPQADIAFSGQAGGNFSPTSLEYRITASTGTIRYAINPPFWLTVTHRIGNVGAEGVLANFTVNTRAQRLPAGTYKVPITFTNLTNGQGTTTRIATLLVMASGPDGYLLDEEGKYLLDHRGGRLLAR